MLWYSKGKEYSYINASEIAFLLLLQKVVMLKFWLAISGY